MGSGKWDLASPPSELSLLLLHALLVTETLRAFNISNYFIRFPIFVSFPGTAIYNRLKLTIDSQVEACNCMCMGQHG
jgi:hypothetical protein